MRRRITMKLKWENRDEGKEVQISMGENRSRKTSESELLYF